MGVARLVGSWVCLVQGEEGGSAAALPAYVKQACPGCAVFPAVLVSDARECMFQLLGCRKLARIGGLFFLCVQVRSRRQTHMVLYATSLLERPYTGWEGWMTAPLDDS